MVTLQPLPFLRYRQQLNRQWHLMESDHRQPQRHASQESQMRYESLPLDSEGFWLYHSLGKKHYDMNIEAIFKPL